ncbi:hypothetical protein F3Y22_tig00117012pilonHSYRG00078 [Hibiscus syriacus]|uniref:Uncharacterized protein n=1 Tax=Hibiscus syriacus TaxID=106335 RepID=A0A6A2XC40_HIBSY|nr:hypothetical protein F3Y22_tig00117012pilonHSYRG00078 [Hibiscus syriacus]
MVLESVRALLPSEVLLISLSPRGLVLRLLTLSVGMVLGTVFLHYAYTFCEGRSIGPYNKILPSMPDANTSPSFAPHDNWVKLNTGGAHREDPKKGLEWLLFFAIHLSKLQQHNWIVQVQHIRRNAYIVAVLRVVNEPSRVSNTYEMPPSDFKEQILFLLTRAPDVAVSDPFQKKREQSFPKTEFGKKIFLHQKLEMEERLFRLTPTVLHS